MTTQHFRSELGRMLCAVSVAGTIVTLPALAAPEAVAPSGCPAQPVAAEFSSLQVGSASSVVSGMGFRQSIEAVSYTRTIALDRDHFRVDRAEPTVEVNRTARKVAGGVLGAVAGFFVGGYAGSAIEGIGGSPYAEDPGLAGFLIGAPVGAVVGAVVGMALASR